ncbi:MAG: Tim44/TimA family putative adaptor protein [Paracoccaceae bacterium]
MNPMTIEILVLAGIAVFLVLRLRNVLGTREGFEKPRTGDSQPDKSPELTVIEGGPDADIIDNVPAGSHLADKLVEIKNVDPDFSVTEFLTGARGAYEMILMAFERGEMEDIRALLSPEVAETFDEVIKNRKAQGLTIEAEFVGIRELKLSDVFFDKATDVADISVSLTGELISVVKNAEGEVVEGDAKQIKRQKDIWTFSKDMGLQDPNWQLVATGE